MPWTRLLAQFPTPAMATRILRLTWSSLAGCSVLFGWHRARRGAGPAEGGGGGPAGDRAGGRDRDRPGGRGRRVDDLDGAHPLQPGQGRVERAVGDAPDVAERLAEPLLQLVAVEGGIREEPENRQFQHGPVRRGEFPVSTTNISDRYIGRAL